jgi:hypothetical protein
MRSLEKVVAKSQSQGRQLSADGESEDSGDKIIGEKRYAGVALQTQYMQKQGR